MSRANLATLAKKCPTAVCTCEHSNQWHVGTGRCTYPGCKCQALKDKSKVAAT